jgi:2-polyprenyl-6-methoxyphenol hydroxylase-like FAD-dependent oxidoreductase
VHDAPRRNGDNEVLPDFLSDLSADVIVIGAGVAGTTAAAVLERKGLRVMLLDTRATCPPVFKAEKVEREALRMLRELNLYKHLAPHCGHISEVYVAYDGHIFKRQKREQIGIAYSDLVNIMRAHLPETIESKIGRVGQISHRDGITTVSLESGEKLTTRLAVLACGLSDELLSSLGLRRNIICNEQSAVAGFNIAPTNSRAFDFDSVTFYPTDPSFRIDYLNLFRMRQEMRVNLFSYHTPNDPWFREFHRRPKALLDSAFPKMSQVIGEYEVVGKVVSSLVDLYRTEGNLPEGVVLIGDAFQNACPATGCGFPKVFTDVRILGECVPEWLSTPGMGTDKLRRFYSDPRKQTEDNNALQRSIRDRQAAISTSPRWRLRRALLHVRRHLTTAKPGPARPQPQKTTVMVVSANENRSSTAAKSARAAVPTVL